MPTYAYRCTQCEHSFEIQQAFTEDSLTVCPECSGALRKLFSGVGVVFKGSGFYRTDSRSGANASVPASTGTSTSSSSSESSSSSTPSSSTPSNGTSSPTSTPAKSPTPA